MGHTLVYKEARSFAWASFTYAGADPKGGWGDSSPPLLVYQWKYGEGEGEEKMERWWKKKRSAPFRFYSASATARTSMVQYIYMYSNMVPY